MGKTVSTKKSYQRKKSNVISMLSDDITSQIRDVHFKSPF